MSDGIRGLPTEKNINFPEMTSADMQLLRLGRHLRLTNGTKMVIGRDENDNAKLLTLNNPKGLFLWVL